MIDGSYIIGSTISAIVTKVTHIDEYYVIVLRDTIAVGMITVSYSIGIVIYTWSLRLWDLQCNGTPLLVFLRPKLLTIQNGSLCSDLTRLPWIPWIVRHTLWYSNILKRGNGSVKHSQALNFRNFHGFSSHGWSPGQIHISWVTYLSMISLFILLGRTRIMSVPWWLTLGEVPDRGVNEGLSGPGEWIQMVWVLCGLRVLTKYTWQRKHKKYQDANFEWI